MGYTRWADFRSTARKRHAVTLGLVSGLSTQERGADVAHYDVEIGLARSVDDQLLSDLDRGAWDRSQTAQDFVVGCLAVQVSRMASAPHEPLCRDLRLTGAMHLGDAVRKPRQPCRWRAGIQRPARCQNDTSTAPTDTLAAASNSTSVSRLRRRRQTALPMPCASNKRSSISSLSMTGRFSATASCRPSRLFPLHGRPESTTKYPSVSW